MPWLALGLSLAYLTLVFGVQALVQRRRTGETGWVGVGEKGPTERVADLLFAVALALQLAAPVLVLTGAVAPIAALDGPGAHATGLAVWAIALVVARAAQRTMGSAWRTGTDPEAPERLVIDGPFSLVRNPVYTSIVAGALAAALLAPTVVGLLAVPAFVLALELQTRSVEEPHLMRVHGEGYADYAARVGRFLPGVGRLRAAGDGGPAPAPRPAPRTHARET